MEPRNRVVVQYWQSGVTLATLKEYGYLALKLLNGDYNPNDLKVLADGRLRYKVNRKIRAIFMTYFVDNVPHLRLLEVLEKHKYKKSQHSKPFVLKKDLEKNREFIDKIIKSAQSDKKESQPLSMDDIEFVPVDYHEQQFITLSSEQEEARDLPLPAVLSGSPGSGKSCLSFINLVTKALNFQSANLALDCCMPVQLYAHVTPSKHNGMNYFKWG